MSAPTTSYHLRPQAGWINDPNGMTHLDGRWHVFFQHNPDAPVHDHIVWGHAVSSDLANWKLLPIAFGPTPGGPDSFGCWSGVYLPGHERPGVVYSGVTDATAQSTVCLRWGSPDLVTWGDPIVVATTPQTDDIAVMRDPFLFELAGRRLAIVGAGRVDGSPVVLLYDRTDELAWRYLGLFLSDEPLLTRIATADIWECPQLVQVADKWVLVLSVHNCGLLSEVLGVVGQLEQSGEEGLRFVAEQVAFLDCGSDFYAPQATVVDGAPLLLGWVRQLNQEPGVRDHAGCLSLPRRLSLRDGVVVSQVDPVAAAALVAGWQSLPAGKVSLAGRRWCVRVDAGEVRLTHPAFGEFAAGVGAEIWVDGDVVEFYPHDGVPSTWRSDEPWTLTVPGDAVAEVGEVGPSVP